MVSILRDKSYLCPGIAFGSLPSTQAMVVTNASHSGWLPVWNHGAVRGTCSFQHGLTMGEVHLSLKNSLPLLEWKHVHVCLDNSLTAYHVNHQGGTRSSQSLWEAQKLLSCKTQRIR